ncbi:MAG: hypothetical protein A2V73_03270 [candidate division Zixibacteria bacterium RBG_19FT_COMBO_42_43]|nr:MAG: hypothetical protein A2V73_03270 [candidate division Zixibacteria bacterium RBG_19FT_COMBO_42_43]
MVSLPYGMPQAQRDPVPAGYPKAKPEGVGGNQKPSQFVLVAAGFSLRSNFSQPKGCGYHFKNIIGKIGKA